MIQKNYYIVLAIIIFSMHTPSQSSFHYIAGKETVEQQSYADQMNNLLSQKNELENEIKSLNEQLAYLISNKEEYIAKLGQKDLIIQKLGNAAFPQELKSIINTRNELMVNIQQIEIGIKDLQNEIAQKQKKLDVIAKNINKLKKIIISNH